jgi:hypothetical protein
MGELRSRSTFDISTTFLKALVWAGFALGVVGLLGLVFNLAPYALAPFNLNWPTQPPGAIEGRMSDAEAKRRIAALRNIAASPQAAATSAASLTIIGINFDRLREDAPEETAHAHTPKAQAVKAQAAPFPMKLDLARDYRTAVVAMSDQAIAWTVVPPRANWPQALLGIESRLFPEFHNPPHGVLAGFRIGTAGGNIAKPLQPDDDLGIDKFCRSLSQWATFFSIPLDGLNYILVADPTALTFDGSGWTSDGAVLMQLDSDELRNACTRHQGWPR